MTDSAVHSAAAAPRAMPVPGRAQVLQAVDRVSADFPFPGYITRGVRQGLATIVPRIARHVQVPRPRLLDIGSGPMDKTAVFQALGFECCAVDDLSDPWHRREGNLQKILDFAERAGIRFHLQGVDHAIPFPEASFDVVNIFDVIEHLHGSPREILNTAGRQLKPGGILAITMPNAVNLRKRLSVLAGRTNFPRVEEFFLCHDAWRGHVREYTLSEAAYICRAAGFTVLTAAGFEGNAHDMLRGLPLQAFLKVVRLAPGLASGLLVVAQRPRGWVPVPADPVAFRRAQAGSIPDSVL